MGWLSLMSKAAHEALMLTLSGEGPPYDKVGNISSREVDVQWNRGTRKTLQSKRCFFVQLTPQPERHFHKCQPQMEKLAPPTTKCNLSKDSQRGVSTGLQNKWLKQSLLVAPPLAPSFVLAAAEGQPKELNPC